METLWKVLGLILGLFYLQLCNGLPINLENSGPDSHTQFLTGLVAVLLTVCSVVLLAGCLCCQRKNGFKEFRDSPVVASVASNLDHGHVNPIANSEFTIFTPISPPHHNNNVFLANQRIVSRAQEDYKYGEIDVTSWFDGAENDFPRTRLKYIRELGKGWFGRVVEGTAQGLSDNPEEWTSVAVRILEANATSRDRVLFLYDATIYRCGSHPNILKLHGRSLDTIPLLILQEYCTEGDLKRYLRSKKTVYEKFLSSDLPLLWCYQLSTAIKFLHNQKISHPDLATRNCQLSEDLNLKVGDYGLSATLYPEDYYEGSPTVPLRWCAPETILYTSTTIQSKQMTLEGNIWSLGVTMWEICECGDQPYSWLNDDEVIAQVVETPKVRLPRPSYNTIYTDYIYQLMQSCWYTSESRPSISQIDLMLADLMQVYEHTKNIGQVEASASIQDFDKRWITLKPNSLVKTDNEVIDIEGFEDSALININALNLHTNCSDDVLNNKKFSASLNNLHGSLDNLLDSKHNFDPMESWLENVATNTDDMSYVRGLSDAIKDLDNAIALENVSSDSSHQPSPVPDNLVKQSKLHFKLGQIDKTLKPKYPEVSQNDSLQDSILCVQRTSSESETEEENWKTKIERGAYSEKVRQKSRSVADLMILTHIDCSESDSETTLPSLDFKVNHKNMRYVKNMENANLKFGSEGNLLNVKETFQEELRKLQEERRDSLLFVPDKFSQNSSSLSNIFKTNYDLPNVATTSVHNVSESSPVKKLIEELNRPSEILPPTQVYNVFNVSIEQKYSPMRLISNTNDLNQTEIKNNFSDIYKNKSDIDNFKSDSGITDTYTSVTDYETSYLGNMDSNICVTGNETDHNDVSEQITSDAEIGTCTSKSENNFRNCDLNNSVNTETPKISNIKLDISTGQSDNNNIEHKVDTAVTETANSKTYNIEDNCVTEEEIKSSLRSMDIESNKINCESFKLNNINIQTNSNNDTLNRTEVISLTSITEDKTKLPTLENTNNRNPIKENRKLIESAEILKFENDKNLIKDLEGVNSAHIIDSINNLDLKIKCEVPKLSEIIQNNIGLLDSIIVKNNLNLSNSYLCEMGVHDTGQVSNNKNEELPASIQEDGQTITEVNKNKLNIAHKTLNVDMSHIPNENKMTQSDGTTSQQNIQEYHNSDSFISIGETLDNINDNIKNVHDEEIQQTKIIDENKQDTKCTTIISTNSLNDSKTMCELFLHYEKYKDYHQNQHEKESQFISLIINEIIDNIPTIIGSNVEPINKNILYEKELNIDEDLPMYATKSDDTGLIYLEQPPNNHNFGKVENFNEDMISLNHAEAIYVASDSIVDLQRENKLEHCIHSVDEKKILEAINESSLLIDEKMEENLNGTNIFKSTEPENGINIEKVDSAHYLINENKTKIVESVIVKNQPDFSDQHQIGKNCSKNLTADLIKSLNKENIDIVQSESELLVKYVQNESKTKIENEMYALKNINKGVICEIDNSTKIKACINLNQEEDIANESLNKFIESKSDISNTQIEALKENSFIHLVNANESTLKSETNENKFDLNTEIMTVTVNKEDTNESGLESTKLQPKIGEDISNFQFSIVDRDITKTFLENEKSFTKSLFDKENNLNETYKVHNNYIEDSYLQLRNDLNTLDQIPNLNNLKSSTHVIKLIRDDLSNNEIPNLEQALEIEHNEKDINSELNNQIDLNVISLTQDFLFNEINTYKDFKSLSKTDNISIEVDTNTTKLNNHLDVNNVLSITQNFVQSDNISLEIDTTNQVDFNKETNKYKNAVKINETSSNALLDNDINRKLEQSNAFDSINKFTQDFLLNEIENYEALNFKDCTKPELKIKEPIHSEVGADDKLEQQFVTQETLSDKQANINSEIGTQNNCLEEQNIFDNTINRTQEFLINEFNNYDDVEKRNKREVKFDLSKSQLEISPNSLTHLSKFTSTPFKRSSIESNVILGASDDYTIDFYSGLKTTVDEAEELQFSSNFMQADKSQADKSQADKSYIISNLFNKNELNHKVSDQTDLNYSLETWDNFLGQSFDDQENGRNIDFNNFNDEPHSLLFLDSDLSNGSGNFKRDISFYKPVFDSALSDPDKDNCSYKITKILNETYTPNTGLESLNKTYNMNENVNNTSTTSNQILPNDTFIQNNTCVQNDTFTKDSVVDLNDVTVTIKNQVTNDNEPKEKESNNSGHWETGGGWFLHPQSNSDDLSGQIVTQEAGSDSYVGFSMDEEIMAAIRNELLTKLPHAQRASSDHTDENEETDSSEKDTAEKNEVFVRYNVYNTPLSPIPEESYIESEESGQITPQRYSNSDNDSSDWSVQDNNSLNGDTGTHSPQRIESPFKGPNNRHTPSQDSCCSNDTLFNLEELNVLNDHEKNVDTTKEVYEDVFELENKLKEKIDNDSKESLSKPLIEKNEGQSLDTLNVNKIQSNGTFNQNEDNEVDKNIENSTNLNAENGEKMQTNTPLQDTVAHVKEVIDDKTVCDTSIDVVLNVPKINIHSYITDFLNNEKYNQLHTRIEFGDVHTENEDNSDIYLTVSDNTFSCGQNVAPLNSPEDKPWKELQASFRRCREEEHGDDDDDCQEIDDNFTPKLGNELSTSYISCEEGSSKNEEERNINDLKSMDNITDSVNQNFSLISYNILPNETSENSCVSNSSNKINEFAEADSPTSRTKKAVDETTNNTTDANSVENVNNKNLTDDNVKEAVENSLENIKNSDALSLNFYRSGATKNLVGKDNTVKVGVNVYTNQNDHNPKITDTNKISADLSESNQKDNEGMNQEEKLCDTNNKNIESLQVELNSVNDISSKNITLKPESIKADEIIYENVKLVENQYENINNSDVGVDTVEYANLEEIGNKTNLVILNNKENSDYTNIINKGLPSNSKNDSNYVNLSNEKYIDENVDDEIKFDRYEDMYGPLTDIRFSGPANVELMTTSFSESNDLADDQDWDSGSDTRSSSSGEFIWKEGEHEASVKALRAAPQAENIEAVVPMEDIQEENESSCSSGSEGEEECPEFVPSAWDKYATPTKSALRSPEKSLKRVINKNKPKGVWFKKQKYHCVYEYPREPDSPVLQSYDIWKPSTDYSTLADWDLDTDPYLPIPDEPDCSQEYQPKTEKSPKNLYHLTTFPDMGTTMLDEDFFISSSSRPFDMLGGLTSQFFPGKQFADNWNDNITPDSGVEDITPATLNDNSTYNKQLRGPMKVQTLKCLAAAAANRHSKNSELGGLRHTRDKLKLDLPPSPSAFTSSKSFTVEPPEEIINRQIPTFTTFGKSRFLVQHVDTPPDDKTVKNVSFEALPYKPAVQYFKDDFDKTRHKIEIVRGEASLLDSADEDSGIESCTLERKKTVDA